MTRGHGWSLTITLRGTFTPYSLPTFTGAFGLTPERIETFFLSYAQAMGQSARRSMQAALRTFLRFCLHQGYIEHPLDRAVPILRTYKLNTEPIYSENLGEIYFSVLEERENGKK